MSPNAFLHPLRLPLIAPSILSADFMAMGSDCSGVLFGTPQPPASKGRQSLPPSDPHLADLLHVDIMDGHFVPNLTMGPDMVTGLRRMFPNAFLDVHLMVTDPWLHAQAFVAAGASHITFHVEVVPPNQIAGLVHRIRGLPSRVGPVSIGLAINPPTSVELLLPHVPHVDLALVMSVNPGYSGQAFIPEVLAKTQRIRAESGPRLRVEMDGGIKPENARPCLDAGCDVVVAASAIFGKPAADRGKAIAALRGL